MSKPKSKRPEAVSGGYSALPWAVMDSPAYTGASVAAKALLNELVRQHTGTNNGRLHLVHTWLAGRGWLSKSIVASARDELLVRGLIAQTRQGGLVIGPTWFGLTWLPISNFNGLDIGPTSYPKGAWCLCQIPPTSRRKPPMKKRVAQPDHRGSTDPTTGAVGKRTDPTTGAIKALFGQFTDPTTGDDVVKPLHPAFPAMAARGWRLSAHQPTTRPSAGCSVFHRLRVWGSS